MSDYKTIDLHDMSFDYRKKVFMKKLQKKFTNPSQSPTLIRNNSSPSYIQSLESKRIARQQYEIKKQNEFDSNRRLSSSLQFLPKDKLLKLRTNTNNSSLSTLSNASNFYEIKSHSRDKESLTGLSNLSSIFVNEKNDLFFHKTDQNIKTHKSAHALSVIPEKKNKLRISSKFSSNDKYYNLDSLDADEKILHRKISNPNLNVEPAIEGLSHENTTSPQTEPTSFSEDHFKKHFKYLHRNKNLVKLKDFVENRDELSKTPSQKTFEGELIDESINYMADLKEKRFRNVKGQRFKKWARLMKCISKVLIMYKKKQELNFLFVQKFTV
jgi:hypothetical protein